MRAPVRLRRENGAASIEAAFILPIFFSVVFGFVQFSMIMCGYNAAAYAAREAARYAIVHGSSSPKPCASSDLKTIVLANSFLVPTSAVTVTSTWNPTTAGAGSTVTVTVGITYKPVIPFVPLGPLTLHAVSQMTVIQ